MKKNLNIGSIKIPVEAATKAFALLAKRGAGKSYTGAVMAEEFAKNGIPFVVFDPIDVWWGLRLAADGKSKGLPVVVFGLQHADIQLDRTMGKKIAQAVVNENISCVISTFGMSKTDMRQIVADFSEELLNINNTPRHVFIEEAHEFVPQRVFGAGARCFASVEALLVMGRNRGIGVTLINQRAATLNKDLLTQVDTLLALRSVGPQDRKALKEWVEFHSAEGDLDKFLASLPSLPTGEAWLWSPEFMETFERITIRKRETFHPDREKLGSTFKMPEIKQGDIQSFIDKFKTPKKIEPQLVKNNPHVLDKRELATEYQRGYHEGVMAMKKEMWAEFEKERAEMQRKYNSLFKVVENIGRLVAGVAKEDLVTGPVPRHIRNEIERVRPSVDISVDNVDSGSITGGARRMLAILASRQMGMTRQQLATTADVKLTGGSFGTYISRLKQSGYITIEGDKIYITNDGESFIGPQNQIKSATDVRDMWLAKMTGGANRMLKILIDVYPQEITKEYLAEASNVSISGGSFGTYVSRLKSNGLIVVDSHGHVKASDTLFEE